jgi:hypothetical protein
MTKKIDEALTTLSRVVPTRFSGEVAVVKAEIERLKEVLHHIDDLSDEFFNVVSIDGRPTYILKPELEKFRQFIQEISIVVYEAVNDDDGNL